MPKTNVTIILSNTKMPWMEAKDIEEKMIAFHSVLPIARSLSMKYPLQINSSTKPAVIGFKTTKKTS